jgi:hypothetical protein
MYFEPSFVLPKIIGLLLMSIWLYTSFRQLWMYKYADIVTGTLVEIADNPEASSTLNKIATIEFSYHGQKVTIEHYYTGSRNDFSKEVTVHVNKKNVKRSIVKPHSKWSILFDFIVPIFFSTLILISFFRIKGC